MGTKTGIEWTDATWNPIRGCSRVSEGCRNCYAEKVAYRFSGEGQPYEGLVGVLNSTKKPVWNGTVRLVEEHLLDPLKWGHVPFHEDTGIKTRGKCECPGRSRRIFVNSMSDLFHENVPDEWIDRIFAVMALCQQHTFQILTKRPERMLAYLSEDARVRLIAAALDTISRQLGGKAKLTVWDNPDGFRGICLPNVWLGVSVENQKAADERIPLLLRTPAAVRFISAEPLLGAMDVFRWLAAELTVCSPRGQKPTRETVRCLQKTANATHREFVGPLLDWVICGGESGPGARPMHPDWARSLRDQCQAAGVPFFFKQSGEWVPGEQVMLPNRGKVETATWFDGRWLFDTERLSQTEGHRDDEPDLYRVGKKAAGALLDGREWPEFPLIEEARGC